MADYALFRILRAYLSSLGSGTWFNLDLFVNDYDPAPGDVHGNYTLPTISQWPGYSSIMLPATLWLPPSVVANVAQTYQPAPAAFLYPTPVPAVTIYGYLVSDGLLNLQWAERFDTPVTPTLGGGISIQPYFNIGILEPEDEAMMAVRALRMADSDDEYEGD